MEYRIAETEELVGHLRFRLRGISDLNEAIDQMFIELERIGSSHMLEELCPYFGTIWPSARLLSRWLLAQGEPVFAGKRVLELGCGLALPSFVAARLGAIVTASDAHPDVESFVAQNRVLNPWGSLSFRRLDWRHSDLDEEPYDWIIGSDVLYERYHAASLISFLQRALAPDGQAVFLDPKRAYWERLVIFARHGGLKISTEDSQVLGTDLLPDPVLLRIYRSKN